MLRRAGLSADTGRSGGRFWHTFVHAAVLPFTLAAVAAAGWYIITGETPLAVFDRITSPPRIVMDMPPRPGPEAPAVALLQPPRNNDPDVKVALDTVPPMADVPKPPATQTAPPPPPATQTGHPPATAPDAPPPPKVLPPTPLALVTPPPPPPMAEPPIPPGGEPLAPPSFAKMPTRTDLKAVVANTQPDLLHASPNGPLPIRAGGKEPRKAYARPFTGEAGRPRIAIVVTGLGLSREATEAAIAKLPPEISLSFSPYAGNLDSWLKRARGNGHEVLLDWPLEPPNFPMRDTGPMAVLVQHTPAEAKAHLEAVLGKATGYVGVAASLRSPVSSSELWLPLLRGLRDRGLLYVGDGLADVAASDAPAATQVTLVADETPFRAAIDVHLARLQAVAQRDGQAVSYVSARPVTFERLLAWTATFPQKGLVLAPLSAVVQTPS